MNRKLWPTALTHVVRGLVLVAGLPLAVVATDWALATAAAAQESGAASAPSDTPTSDAMTAIEAAIEAERWREALELGRAELARRKSATKPDASILLDLESSLMFCQFQLGDLDAARTLQRSVIERRAKLSPELVAQRADDWNDLAMISNRLGDDEDAANAWSRSITLLQTLDSADAAAKIVPRLSALAEAERRLGRYESSENKMRDAIDLSERHRPRNQRHAQLLNNLGALCWDERRYDEATRLLHEALRITEEDPESTPLRLAVAQHNLANLAREQGDLDESERRHRETLKIAREHLSADPQFPVFLKELAVLDADEGRLDEAFTLWDEALAKLAENPQPLLASEVRYERGCAELEIGKLDAAETSLRSSLAMRESTFENANHPMIGQALVGLGSLQAARGFATDARRSFERAARILDVSVVYPEERVEAHVGIAQLDWAADKRDEAVARMSRALDLAEQLRVHRAASETSRADWVRRQVQRTDRMIGWLSELERLDEAIAVSERVRGRILLDQMLSAHVDWRRDVTPELRTSLESRERSALATIRARRRDLETAVASGKDAPEKQRLLDEAVAAYGHWTEEARAQSPVFSRALRSASVDDALAEVRRHLAPDEIVLLYHVGAERTRLFEVGSADSTRCTALVSSKTTTRGESLPLGEAELETMLATNETNLGRAERLRGVGKSRPANETAEARTADLVRLGAALLPASVRERVLAARRVHVIPDGALHGFPFEALVLEEKDGQPVYWLEDGPEICYGHSLATLAEILARGDAPAATRAIVTVNDPSYGDSDGAPDPSATDSNATSPLHPTRRWPPLPGTRAEGEALRSAFASGEIVDLTAGQAREAEVKRVVPGARLLHFGTHGIVEQERSDLLAALVLAQEPAGSAEDGFLHLFEVYELGLDADLVVLSACETTLGRRVRGEGVFALSRGFLAAGSRRVVASLWSVDDEATAALMSEFFGELGTGVDAATALTRAKRTLRDGKKWKDPFFWAPFVLSGRF